MSDRLTFAIIKPNVVKKNNAGRVLQMIEKEGFIIKNLRMIHLSKQEASDFYAVHEGKEFFNRLVEFMTSGKIIAVQLEKDNAVKDFRTLAGSTNPKDATEGTIRQIFGETVTINAVHGSDSNENAKIESEFFF